MKKLFRGGLSLLALAGIAPISHALTFNFTPAPGMDVQAYNGFVAAGNRWSALFSDPITVNLDIDFAPLDPGILASTSPLEGTASLGAFKGALGLDISSSADAIAYANLPGTSAGGLVNRTVQHPGATPFFDNNGSHNNTTFVTTSANAKALGMVAPNDPTSDGSITFSSAFTYDFNPNDGISPGAFDFVGIVTHELGHALGFISNVDLRDYYTANVGLFSEDQSGLEQTLMDLYRFSGTPGTAQRDWTIDNRTKFFSIDGGATAVANISPEADFSNGLNFGDSRQASHWKDGLGLGIMDPTAAPGELLAISANDIEMFDVLGYDLNVVPEANTIWAGLTLASLGAAHVRRRNARS